MKLECLPQKAKRGELLVAHGRKKFSARSRDDGGFGGTIRVGKAFWLTATKGKIMTIKKVGGTAKIGKIRKIKRRNIREVGGIFRVGGISEK